MILIRKKYLLMNTYIFYENLYKNTKNLHLMFTYHYCFKFQKIYHYIISMKSYDCFLEYKFYYFSLLYAIILLFLLPYFINFMINFPQIALMFKKA